MKGLASKLRPAPPVILLALADAREELFALLVCDGMPLVDAFVRCGFAKARTKSAGVMAANLSTLSRVQARMAAILEARRHTAAVTLPEVTDMLKRVFAGALADAEYAPAHNAAFSLARLHGHVVDRAQVEVIRRPTRDPDAPAERALEGWLQALPGPSLEALNAAPLLEAMVEPSRLEGSNANSPEALNDHSRLGMSLEALEPSSLEKPNEIKGLDGAGRSENGAPIRPVTGTPSKGARDGRKISEPRRGTPKKKRVPRKPKRVPGLKRDKGFRRLFG